jgi:hypothetical protein
MTWLDLITDSLIEIGAYAPGDPIPDSVMQVVLRRLNYRIESWSALKRYVYNVDFPVYTLTPNVQPVLFGPNLTAPNFATPNAGPRPVKIEGANLVLNGSNPTTDLIINVRDDAWWLNQQVKQLTSTLPTDLYYSTGWPSGSIYFWPIPTVANDVRLEIWVALQQVDADSVTSDFSAPQGYPLALMLTLAEDLTTVMSKPMPVTLPNRARLARVAIQSNNIASPRIASADYGAGLLPRRRGFNWESGMPS